MAARRRRRCSAAAAFVAVCSAAAASASAEDCPAQRGGEPPRAVAAADGASQDEARGAVQLLQRAAAAGRRHSGGPEQAPPELQRVLPISWVHVPKTGTSFANTLMFAPGVCPGIPINPLKCPCENISIPLEERILPAFCPGLLSYTLRHPGIEEKSWMPGWEAGQGHFMTFLRQPEQRLVSAYQDILKAMKFGLPIVEPNKSSWGGWWSNELPSLEDFARQQRGCAVRMLTRGGYPCMDLLGPPLTPEDVAEARRRLRTGFSFVGITDYWDLSLCLFDAMFKVGCRDYQFADARPGKLKKRHNETTHPTTGLNGVTDAFDGELYAEGLDVFRGNLLRYGVSLDSCEPCWRQAGVSLEEARAQGMP